MTPLTLTVRETAEALRVGKNTVYELIRHGDIPAVRIGRAIRIPEKGLHAWLETQSTNTERKHR